MRQTRLTYTSCTVVVIITLLLLAASFWRSRISADPPPDENPGARLFREKGCVQCHYPDRTAEKHGPGLKNILQADTLPASGRPATRANVRQQLLDPYDHMPSYKDRLSEEQLRLLLDYLASL